MCERQKGSSSEKLFDYSHGYVWCRVISSSNFLSLVIVRSRALHQFIIRPFTPSFPSGDDAPCLSWAPTRAEWKLSNIASSSRISFLSRSMTIWRWILNDPRSQDHNHGMEYLYLWSRESPELVEVDHMDHVESEYKLSKKTYNWSWLWGVVQINNCIDWSEQVSYFPSCFFIALLLLVRTTKCCCCCFLNFAKMGKVRRRRKEISSFQGEQSLHVLSSVRLLSSSEIMKNDQGNTSWDPSYDDDFTWKISDGR